MNILPKKRWHVRTKDNIARVRRDEAKAAEEAKELEKRIKLADQEARTSFLRKKAQERKPIPEDLGLNVPPCNEEKDGEILESSDTLIRSADKSSVLAPSGHVNFFQHLEEGESTSTGNKDREDEEKKEKEEYEKKIGLLTYLGQDSHELTGERSWWQKIPEKRILQPDSEEQNDKQKTHRDMLDPLNSVRMHLGCKGVQQIAARVETKSNKHSLKKKKHKKRSSSSSTSDEERYSKSKKKYSKKGKHKKKGKKYSKDPVKEKKASKHKTKKKSSNTESTSEENESDSNHSKANRQRKDTKEISEQEEKRLKLEILRMERIERENKSKVRKNELLYGTTQTAQKDPEKEALSSKSSRKYNSQFNPQFAKQNKLDASQKYWLQ